MFDDFKVANYSKSLVSPELYARHLSRLLTGDVLDGFTLTPGTGLQVVLAPGNALIRYGSAAVASARLVSLVANFNLAIGTADVSNPRIDVVVVYVDNGVSLPGGTPSTANLDGKGVPKAKIVQGTPNASPTAPNPTAIQASVGAGNPYTVVGTVRVNAGVTVLAGNLITDVRALAVMAPEKIDAVVFEYLDAGSTISPSISGGTLIDVTGVSTTVTNPYSVPVQARVTLDFMALGAGPGATGMLWTIQANGVDQVQRFTSIQAALWTTITKSWIITIPASSTITIKPRARIGGAGSVTWGRDNTDPAYRTRIVTEIIGV